MGLRSTVSKKLARSGRIAKGMLRSDSRQRYLEELRRRRPTERPVKGEEAEVTDGCLACGSDRVRDKSITCITAKHKGKSFVVVVCKSCGHVANPDNFNDYTQYTSLEKMPVKPRVGTDERAGREYWMAKMATTILGGRNREVMLYGPGRSKDYRRINELKPVDRVAVGDIMQFIDDAEWVDLGVSATAENQFDLVIASEVVEHFTNPAEDFPKLFSYVKKDGLALCSTNINNGGDLTKAGYLFTKGHTSYYSPQAIASIAAQNDMYFDFRLPTVANSYGGPRKRYVFFTRSPEVLQNIALYFGSHPYAPST